MTMVPFRPVLSLLVCLLYLLSQTGAVAPDPYAAFCGTNAFQYDCLAKDVACTYNFFDPASPPCTGPSCPVCAPGALVCNSGTCQLDLNSASCKSGSDFESCKSELHPFIDPDSNCQSYIYTCSEDAPIRGYPGDSCGNNRDCALGLECGSSNPSSSAATPSPMTCQGLGLGAACVEGACAHGFYCAVASGYYGGVCLPTLPLGSLCIEDHDCGDFAFCSYAVYDADNGTCAPAFTQPEGGVCFTQFGACGFGTVCDVKDETCYALPPAAKSLTPCTAPGDGICAPTESCACYPPLGSYVCIPDSGYYDPFQTPLILQPTCDATYQTYKQCVLDNQCSVSVYPSTTGPLGLGPTLLREQSCVQQHCSEEFNCFASCAYTEFYRLLGLPDGCFQTIPFSCFAPSAIPDASVDNEFKGSNDLEALFSQGAGVRLYPRNQATGLSDPTEVLEIEFVKIIERNEQLSIPGVSDVVAEIAFPPAYAWTISASSVANIPTVKFTVTLSNGVLFTSQYGLHTDVTQPINFGQLSYTFPVASLKNTLTVGSWPFQSPSNTWELYIRAKCADAQIVKWNVVEDGAREVRTRTSATNSDVLMQVGMVNVIEVTDGSIQPITTTWDEQNSWFVIKVHAFTSVGITIDPDYSILFSTDEGSTSTSNDGQESGSGSGIGTTEILLFVVVGAAILIIILIVAISTVLFYMQRRHLMHRMRLPSSKAINKDSDDSQAL